MIDTDKYEGHTPAPWTMTEDMQSVMIPANHQSMDDMKPYIGSSSNARLIADAPLLLAEVLRLRKQHDEWSDKAEKMRKQAHELHHMMCLNIIANLTPKELYDKAKVVYDPYFKPRPLTGKPLFGIGD